ncbi:hypothetical protein IMZ16_08090 [Cruoricaptor ignavus]|uniref:Winged helix DNA-binding domain-containing protein n=1 Tax=Cruoricaptor ignavus TaxID=1118202 RepID=A0A7M1T0X2_9FLAO|nr:hypothetical protein [Cruoricaptor ignavus]QOR73478.1 hypothetical protein IMZ16_08090 [Cruoricaptor ignavus]
MQPEELLKLLKDKNFRTSEAENPELVSELKKLEEAGLIRMMTSADDGSISVAITTEGFNLMTKMGLQHEGKI